MVSPGDTIWWRGFRCVVTGVAPDVGAGGHGIVHYETIESSQGGPLREGGFKRIAVYQLSSNVEDLVWNEDFDMWTLPGIEGDMPHYDKTGTLIDPPLPTCDNCGAVTYRAVLCAPCSDEAMANGAKMPLIEG